MRCAIVILDTCPIGTIFSLLMDLADCSTISQCEELFSYVEAQMHQWKMVSWVKYSMR